MAIKKDIRSDNTYMISTDSTDNPKLGAKILSDGRESLFLDYYFGLRTIFSEKLGKEVRKKDRKREFMSLYLWQAPRTSQERQQNKETLELAKKIRFERAQEVLETEEGYRLKMNSNINFLDWMWGYYLKYTKGDKRHIKRAYDQFKCFLTESADYNRFANMLRPTQLTKQMIIAFTEFLINKYTGEGPHTTYSRFKKIIKAAVEADVIRKNPCTGVSIRIDKQALRKEILSEEEVQALAACTYEGQNPNIRRAFLFCLCCGLRWCDVKDLTYANVDFANRFINFEQNKTKGHSSKSSVAIPFNDNILQLIGTPQTDDPKTELVFPLPSHTMCLKALRHWTAKAGITKHITWHCARHSFATIALDKGANVKTVANLLGHSDLTNTEKYLRVIDARKREAIDSLPTFNV